MHKELAELINREVPGAKCEVDDSRNGDSVIYFNAEHNYQVLATAKSNNRFPFRVLQVITGTDYQDRLEVSYILATFDPANNHQVILKTKLPREGAELESVVPLWKAANFQERECFDMVGVKFRQHPDLRRILCPDDWEGFPLRKDYQVAQKYRHMVVNPEEKMNLPERGFVDVQKENENAVRPELNWE